ncbi:MAG: indolepyruvate ferredoxin oxidoreductase [Actinomycetota bacterium]|nr:indolepyruvate ferredoxin oxidoreductase [Actinomycetota bacterium]
MPVAVTLDDKYLLESGRVYLTGTQALVRLPMMQRQRDLAAGLNTGCYISGYRGSPLGGFDQALWQAKRFIKKNHIEFQPGVNEDLAATALWGTQQIHLYPGARYDGVFGMWYGKGPGVDRSGDAFRHANLHGTGRGGGVIAAAGDDPAAKSSTLPHGSEVALYDAGMPILTPGTPQEVLDLGRHGYELSRFSGCWVGMKIVTAVADGFAQAVVDPGRIVPVRPELSFDGVPWAFVQRPKLFLPDTLELEAELYDKRHEAARAYAAANRLNVIEVDPADAWITLVAPGRTYRELRQALAELGLASDVDVAAAGIRLVRLGMIFPLDPGLVRDAVRGVSELLVVEEKRSFVEWRIRDILYSHTERPLVLGKRDESGRPLVPADGELNAERLAGVLRAWLGERLSLRPAVVPRELLSLSPAGPVRRAAFCSGCPHNRSTVEASGSPVGAGVGCHAMVLWTDRGAVSYSQMGGEGAQWLGRAPFTDVPHWVQNVGDGTFFHSGSLAVRAAVAAGVSMTFKLLYNGTVAMTGGQDPAGQQSVEQVVSAMAAEGVVRTIVVTDSPERYRNRWGRSGRIEAWDRARLADAEQQLAAIDGVTMLVYDQGCAAELRRMRKRGKAPVRPRRVVINEAVCEGCGDCGVKSSCLSVHPVDTELGRKTQIHQSSCNTDYSCLEGDCPSFVTVEAPADAVPRPRLEDTSVPEPVGRASVVAGRPYAIVAAGIGGTGVVTLNQVLGTAAFLEGLVVTAMDQTGLSQKGGPVVSHLILSAEDNAGANSVSPQAADLFLALDPVVAVDPRYLGKASSDRTATVASSSLVPTISMVVGDAVMGEVQPLLDTLASRTRPGQLTTLDTVAVSETLFGDSVGANLIALGAAYQAGRVPLSAESLESAIRINGVSVERNIAAFRAGRLAVHSPSDLRPARRTGELRRSPSAPAVAIVDRLAAGRRLSVTALRRAAELVDYQGSRLAARYLDLVAAASMAEAARTPGTTGFTDAVTEAFFHLLAYKDEYEVARLHLLPEFRQALAEAVPGGQGARYWLHPPVLRSLGMTRKLAIPASVVDPAFVVLRAMRKVRGTRLDPFGATAIRRTERRLAADYEAEIVALLPILPTLDLAAATALAALPLAIKGYESIKFAAVERCEAERQQVRRQLGLDASLSLSHG